MALKFSTGNAKLGKHTLVFNLPAGRTCPGALFCKSFAVIDPVSGKRTVQDTEHTQFRCFAASSEALHTNAYLSRKGNLDAIVELLSIGVEHTATQLNVALQHFRTRKTTLVRIHESGDFFSAEYLAAWLEVARRNPELKFYCYSKSLHLFLRDTDDAQKDQIPMPSNFYMTASYGGKYDHLIDRNYFPRYAKVVMDDAQAAELGLPVDHDDTHCFAPGPFALLVHGTQPAGSETGKAIRARRKAGQFSGYAPLGAKASA